MVLARNEERCENICATVAVCQQCKLSRFSIVVWDESSMDFIQCLCRKGVDTILVVVDKLSKFAHFLCLKHPFTTLSVANVFIK